MSDNNNDNHHNKMNQSTLLTLNDRFERLCKLFDTTIGIINNDDNNDDNDKKSFNYEFLIDLLIAVYTDIQRFVSKYLILLFNDDVISSIFFYNYYHHIELSKQQEIKIQVHKNFPILSNH